MPQDLEDWLVPHSPPRAGRPDRPGRGDSDLRTPTGSRLIPVAQWAALIGGIIAVLACIAGGAAIASSHTWRATRLGHHFLGSGWGAGSFVMLGGVLVGIFVAVLLYAVASRLDAHLRGGAVFFAAVAGLLALLGAEFLIAPDLLLGDVGSSAAFSPDGVPTDVGLAGLAFLVAAALVAAAAGMAAGALVSARRRATASDRFSHPVERLPVTVTGLASPATTAREAGRASAPSGTPPVALVSNEVDGWNADGPDAPTAPQAPETPGSPDWADDGPESDSSG